PVANSAAPAPAAGRAGAVRSGPWAAACGEWSGRWRDVDCPADCLVCFARCSRNSSSTARIGVSLGQPSASGLPARYSAMHLDSGGGLGAFGFGANGAGAMFRRTSPSFGDGGGGGSPPQPPASIASETAQWMRTPGNGWKVCFTVVLSTAFCSTSSMALLLPLPQSFSKRVAWYFTGLSCRMIRVSPRGMPCTYSGTGALAALAGSMAWPLRSNSRGGATLAAGAGSCTLSAFFAAGSAACRDGVRGGGGNGTAGGGAFAAGAVAAGMKRTSSTSVTGAAGPGRDGGGR